MNAGQPVTFTDFFGLLVGEHILGPEVNIYVLKKNTNFVIYLKSYIFQLKEKHFLINIQHTDVNTDVICKMLYISFKVQSRILFDNYLQPVR